MSVVLGGSLQVDEVRINKHLQLAVTDDRVLNADEDAVSLFQIPPEIAPLKRRTDLCLDLDLPIVGEISYNPSALASLASMFLFSFPANLSADCSIPRHPCGCYFHGFDFMVCLSLVFTSASLLCTGWMEAHRSCPTPKH